ncbi:MAG: hypothetical protein LBP86_08975 [Azoarcus sp.]|nr:hypothetical protein [Azoarcus sp.]
MTTQEAGLKCAYFHGGMNAADKRAVQEAFVHGDALRVIVASNAFGMGIDKPDVCLVCCWPRTAPRDCNSTMY